MDALSIIGRADPAVAVILMTAYGGVSRAVESLKRGANDFLLKPWRNEALIAAVERAIAHTAAARATVPLDVLERDAIAQALARHSGNVAQAAGALGLSRQGLYRRISKHGL